MTNIANKRTRKYEVLFHYNKKVVPQKNNGQNTQISKFTYKNVSNNKNVF